MRSYDHPIHVRAVIAALFIGSVACLSSGGPSTNDSSDTQADLVATYTAIQAREQSQSAQAVIPMDIEIAEQPLVVGPQPELCDWNTARVGGTLWHTDFDSQACLTLFAISNSRVAEDEYAARITENGKFKVSVHRNYTSVYAIADHLVLGKNESDVEVDLALDYLGGPNETGFSLLCRVNPLGWYEFLITSGGRWQIMRTVDSGVSFDILAAGGIDFRNYGLKSFRQGSYNFQARCVSEELSLAVNGIPVIGANVPDLSDTHSTGSVGFALFTLDSIWDFKNHPVLVEFDSFEVRRP